MKKLVFHRYVLQKGEVYKERIIFSYIHLAIFFTINSPKKPNPNQKKPTKQKKPKIYQPPPEWDSKVTTFSYTVNFNFFNTIAH